MCKKKSISFRLFVILAGFATLLPLFAATPVHAQAPALGADNGNCINCHEDLYFLHDTGKWFCIRESPMRCVDCHGGDPAATTQKIAHYDRSAHPVINEDISKCQECHLEECDERVSKFDEVAGLKQVKLVYPAPVPNASNRTPSLPAAEEQDPVNGLLVFEFLPLVILVSLALTIYILQKVHRS